MSSPASLESFERELNRLVAKFEKEFTAVTDPGYLFRTAAHDRFICEVKKPRVTFGPRDAFQAKRYAYNKKVVRALDTDFLEFLDEARRELAGDLLKHNDRADLLEGTRLNETV